MRSLRGTLELPIFGKGSIFFFIIIIPYPYITPPL